MRNFSENGVGRDGYRSYEGSGDAKKLLAQIPGGHDYKTRTELAIDGALKESYKTGYWRAYAQAIRDADVELQKLGDDRAIRIFRKALLALVGIEYHPEFVMDEPTWPSEIEGVRLTIL